MRTLGSLSPTTWHRIMLLPMVGTMDREVCTAVFSSMLELRIRINEECRSERIMPGGCDTGIADWLSNFVVYGLPHRNFLISKGRDETRTPAKGGTKQNASECSRIPASDRTSGVFKRLSECRNCLGSPQDGTDCRLIRDVIVDGRS